MTTLRQTASQKENKTSLDAQPSRDVQAIVLPITAIAVKKNPRSDLGDLTELKTSIANKGVLNPLLVAKTAAGWELLGGRRRLECAKQLGIADIPCRVVKTEEPEVIKLLDNIMREALSPQDECLALKRLLPAFDSKSALARALSKNPSYVTRAIKVADMIEAGLCAGAKLTKTALMELADAPDPQAALIATADGKKESIRQARDDVAAGMSKRKLSGALPGGRAIAQAVHFRESKGGAAFRLRINFDGERTPPETKAEIIRELERILSRLKSEASGKLDT